MNRLTYVTGSILALLHTMALAAADEPSIPFVDGRWSGDIETGTSGTDFKECWAKTTFGDNTTLTLAKQIDGEWDLRLSNPQWRIPPSHQYKMTALVDYYPQQVSAVAEAKSKTEMEIADLDRISLLELIENGHTLELTADGFSDKYDLEGSAKIIQRIRNCFADRS